VALSAIEVPSLEALPLALARARHELRAGDEVEALVRGELAGAIGPAPPLAEVVRSAAFHPIATPGPSATGGATGGATLRAMAIEGLPDHVGPSMRLLCCGLNPSLHAAAAGVGYVTPSNRFWRALAEAGLASVDRDPVALLERDGIGMTDLVQRPTARASEVTTSEFRAGLPHLERLCAWLRPGALVVVGLAGWRAAVDRRAVPGWQPAPLGGVRAYLLPSTSGLNAGTSLADLVDHLRAAAG
jgi:TDG/mug DNA glycosylase family protein